jgi:Uma2 family endonuclease
MATTAVTIQEYRSTVYEADCEYVDGEVLERNWGESDHSRLQTSVGAAFYNRRKEWGICALFALRIQVSPTRIRVPDVCVFLGQPEEQIPTIPPFICVEILSPEDRILSMFDKVADYLNFGVPYVWLLDPQTRKAWRCTPGAMLEVPELRTENPTMVVPIADLFD